MPAPILAVIDDDPLVRGAISSLVRSLGYGIAPFDSAEAFLEAAPTEVACILTDLQMPGLSGLDLCRLVREEGSQVPMILMTAYATPQTWERAAAYGLVALLEKPLDPDRLAASLVTALR
ncbi:response regulator transcription factor [Sphingomonas pokkalii]|uniref:response regulator transcription factor n=1 Tax=Sphingomonas pokkalii TaxID=2175090 RepID=UPI001403BA81|nr:response regulator [Sphingomonas pokkalii]